MNVSAGKVSFKTERLILLTLGWNLLENNIAMFEISMLEFEKLQSFV